MATTSVAIIISDFMPEYIFVPFIIALVFALFINFIKVDIR